VDVAHWHGYRGAAAYAGVVIVSAEELTRAVREHLVNRAEITRLVFLAYLAGGALLVVAAVFNPIGPSLIVASGVSSGFGAMAGLTLVPSLVERRTAGIGSGGSVLARSIGWIAAGLVVGTFFVAIIGPGIRF
jgi:asparagine N-glycosylation enzyme membrane subunit Stt3